jgi:deoxyadenosine/deoxycytidine kinase
MARMMLEPASGRPCRHDGPGVAPLIAILGNIGAGKSTAVRRLAPALGLRGVEEDYASNPFLERFYEDQRRWAFRSQLWFLTASDRDEHAVRESGAVKELTPHFVHEVMTTVLHDNGKISAGGFAILADLAAELTAALEPPDVVVLLTASTDALRERIAARGRGFEQAIAAVYLQQISDRYEAAIEAWDQSPVVRIDTEAVDLRRPAGAEAAIAEIAAAVPALAR